MPGPSSRTDTKMYLASGRVNAPPILVSVPLDGMDKEWPSAARIPGKTATNWKSAVWKFSRPSRCARRSSRFPASITNAGLFTNQQWTPKTSTMTTRACTSKKTTIRSTTARSSSAIPIGLPSETRGAA